MSANGVGAPVHARGGGVPVRGGVHGAARLRAVRGKYWPPVRRIDQAYGDRNLVCLCPPAGAFED